MGFFSSRKTEDGPTYIGPTDDKSVVKVIRSRFYGKGKQTPRETSNNSVFNTQQSTIHTLSHPTRATRSTLSKKSSASNISQDLTSHHRSILQSNASSLPKARLAHVAQSGHSTIRFTDTITITLAQRLNELANANAQGLLDDNEYRLLRQDLFERFADNTPVPSEAPVVPISRHPHITGSSVFALNPARPPSQFLVETARSPSIKSKSSMASGVTGLLRRATERRPSTCSQETTDISSLVSSKSGLSSILKLPRLLSRRTSQSSLMTDISQVHTDAISIASRRTDRSHSDQGSHVSPYVTRSIGGQSIRRMATPPSSFHAHSLASEARRHPMPSVDVQNVFDGDHLESSQRIRDELLAVEAEKRRLLDAFNGLELRTLTKQQRKGGGKRFIAGMGVGGETQASVLMPPDEQHPPPGMASDTASVKSGISANTSLSRSRSLNRKPLHLIGASGATLSRKSSSASSTSHWNTKDIPPVPPLPSNTNIGTLGSVVTTSDVSLARSMGRIPPSLDILAEGAIKPALDDSHGDFDHEIDQIRRRRTEVGARYDARLEYLQAKLKSVQMHDKLLGK